MESNCVIHQQTRPRMLKDFLQDQNLPFPPPKSSIAVFINAAVSSVKSPSIFRRTISRRLSKSRSKSKRIEINTSSTSSSSSYSNLQEVAMARTTSVTVKDILRWRSFRDLAEEVSVPPPASPSRCTSTTTTTTSPGSSWCDSDFTVGDSPVWCRGFSGDIEVGCKKNFHINVAGGDRLRTKSGATRDPMDQLPHEEEEQCSPISVLDFAFQDDEENFSSFNQSLANMERRNFMLKQRIQDFENLIELRDCHMVNKKVNSNEEVDIIEENAMKLMNLVKATSSSKECEANVDVLLLDYFRDELIRCRDHDNYDGELELKILRVANAWVTGEDDGSLEWKMDGNKEVCIRDMEKRVKWNKFEEEQEEISTKLGTMVFDNLLNELLADLTNA